MELALQTPFIRRSGLNPFRNVLVFLVGFVLQVAVATTGAHRSHGAHSSVLFVALAVHRDDATGRFVRTGEVRTEHHGVGPGGDGFDRVARVPDPAVGDHGHVVSGGDVRDLRDGGDLGHARTRDDAGSTDRAGADSDLESVREVDDGFCGLARSNVSDDDIGLDGPFDRAGAIDDVHVVGMGAVDKQHVRTGLVGGDGALLLEGTDRDAHTEAFVRVVDRVAVLAALEDPLHGDEAQQVIVLVDDGDALDLVIVHEFERLARRDVLGCGDDLVGHRLSHRVAFADFEVGPDVRPRDDPEHLLVLVDDGSSRNALVFHHLIDLLYRLFGACGHHIPNDEFVGALDALDRFDHSRDVHVSVEDAEPALSGHLDRQLALGDRVHRRRKHGHVEGDVRRYSSTEIGVVGFDAALFGAKQHVIKGERLGHVELVEESVTRHINRLQRRAKRVARRATHRDSRRRSSIPCSLTNQRGSVASEKLSVGYENPYQYPSAISLIDRSSIKRAD